MFMRAIHADALFAAGDMPSAAAAQQLFPAGDIIKPKALIRKTSRVRVFTLQASEQKCSVGVRHVLYCPPTVQLNGPLFLTRTFIFLQSRYPTHLLNAIQQKRAARIYFLSTILVNHAKNNTFTKPR